LVGLLQPLSQTAVPIQKPPRASRPPQPELPDPVTVGLTAKPKTAVSHITEPIFETPPEPTEEDMAGLLAALNLDETAIQNNDLDSFWDAALGQTDAPTTRKDTLSLEEATAFVEGLPLDEVDLPTVEETTETTPSEPVEVDMDGLLAALHLSETETAVDLDEFWEGALTEEDINSTRKGLSFEEAVQRGLIDLNNQE